MENHRNYYRILHVQPDAPVEIIESSYRTLMQSLKRHPDLGGDHWNAFVINKARDVLTDSKQRAEYDRGLMQRQALPVFLRAKENASHITTDNGTDSEGAIRNPCLFCNRPIGVNSAYDPDASCPNCHSPLNPVVSIVRENSCKRAIRRVRLLKPIMVYLDWPLQTAVAGELKNLSPSGLQFVCHATLQPNQIIKIDSENFAAVGKITNRVAPHQSGTPGFVVGVKFLTLRFERSSGTFISTQA